MRRDQVTPRLTLSRSTPQTFKNYKTIRYFIKELQIEELQGF